MQCNGMINAVERRCISHVVSGTASEEELPSSVMLEVKVEERAAPDLTFSHITANCNTVELASDDDAMFGQRNANF